MGNSRINLKNTWKQIKMKTRQSKHLGWGKGGPEREVYYNSGLPWEAKKVPNTQSNLTLKGARKRTANKA